MPENLVNKILIIDHDLRWQRLIKRHFSREFELEADLCSSKDEAIERIQTNNYLFAILDLSLDIEGLGISYDGLELLRKLDELNIFIPIIVVSGNDDLNYAIDAFNYDNVVHYSQKKFYDTTELKIRMEKKISSIIDIEKPLSSPIYQSSNILERLYEVNLNQKLLEYELIGKRKSYILFMDCENFSGRTDKQQANIFQELITIAKNTVIIKEAIDGHGFTPLLTGDGIAIIFVNEDYSLFPLRLAFEIQHKFNQKNLDLKFRSGIHFGDLYCYLNPLGLKQFLGSQLNITARIMDLGSGNHILSSKDYYSQYVENSSDLNIEGIEKVNFGKRRHPKGIEIEIYNYFTPNLGNKTKKLRK